MYPFKTIYLQWEPQTSAYLVAIACSQAYLSRSAEERAGRAEAAPAERLDELLAGRYPEPAYVVEFAYPGLQTPQEASASSSSILPSQDRYRGVWCVNPYYGIPYYFGATWLSALLTQRWLTGMAQDRRLSATTNWNS